ncbi:MAG: hypothetical protein HRT93_02950 [Piscirickettsiaceae bacterium]|nr:hypothetical protein [Piscirickettsiaceae bacterium]
MNSRAVALNGVGYGSLALATNGLWWVQEVLDKLPSKTVERLYAQISDRTTLRVGETIVRIIMDADMDDLVNNLIRNRPPVVLEAKLEKSLTIRTRAPLSSSEIVEATANAVVRLVSKLEGDE